MYRSKELLTVLAIAGGVYLATGATRAWGVGACCYSDDSCAEVASLPDCTAGGGFYLGDGSTCLGDPDGDGKDNACFCPCQCDVNDDGFCGFVDINAVDSCIGLPPEGDCALMDVDCDGEIDDFDTCAALCRYNLGAPEHCCGPQTICGACCDSSGFCLILPPGACQTGDHNGPNTECLRDPDGDGIDNACFCPCDCDADLDGDCDLDDGFRIVDCIYGAPVDCANADINCDGAIDYCDVDIFECLFTGGGPECCNEVVCGACCYEDPPGVLACVFATEERCVDDFSGSYAGHGTECRGDPDADGNDNACLCPCDCDVNGDEVCDLFDVLAIMECHGLPPTGMCALTDIDCDGDTDQFDMCALLCRQEGGNPEECCGPDTICGACCSPDKPWECLITMPGDCVGDHQGPGTDCDACPCPCDADLDDDGGVDFDDVVRAIDCFYRGQHEICDDVAAANTDGDGVFLFDNSAATTDGPAGIDNDVWFCWTADCDTDVTVATCGLTCVDTKIAVYEGCACSPLGFMLAANDDACGPQSSVTFVAAIGQSYLIRVGSSPGEPSGFGRLSITTEVTCPPANSCDVNCDGITDHCDVDTVLGIAYQGLSCDTVVCGACCVDDDAGTGSKCTQATGGSCDDLDGVYKCDGTRCLGDNDCNGLDDRCQCLCDCDVDEDGFCTSGYDLPIILDCMGQPPTCPCLRADINCDGDIDYCDYDLFSRTEPGGSDACDTLPCGVCCFDDGEGEPACTTSMPPGISTTCEVLLGGAYMGDDTNCLGDSDGNGLDDACPCPCICDVDGDEECTMGDREAVEDCINGDCSGCVNSCDVTCDLVIDECDLDAVDCLIAGGGLECCEIPGACCLTCVGPESCEQRTYADCVAGGGTYVGCYTTCLGDLDKDGIDDACPCPCDTDLNDDGAVDMTDFAMVLNCRYEAPDACEQGSTLYHMGDGRFPFDNSAATTDGAPGIDNDVWFCWTAGCDTDVTLETCGLTCVDTKIAVYQGCACPAEFVLEVNDNACGTQSRVTFAATAGESYLIRVGSAPGQAGGVGSFGITTTPVCRPCNACDVNCDGATDWCDADIVFQAYGSDATCDTVVCGACCTATKCETATQATCEGTLSGSYIGDGVPCPGYCDCGAAVAETPQPEAYSSPCVTDEDCLNEATCINDTCYAPKNRYVSFVPDASGDQAAYRVIHPATGLQWWVDTPFEAPEDPGVWVGRLVDTPVFRVWPEPVVHIGDCAIVPVASYEIHTYKAVDCACGYSDALVLPTIPRPFPKYWADVVGPKVGLWTPPENVVNMDDIMAAVQKFQDDPTAPPLPWVDVDPEVPNAILNFTDIMRIVQGFKGEEYPFSNPEECP